MRGSPLALLCVLTLAVPAVAGAQPDDPANQLVAVAIVKGGESVLLATPGLEERGRYWRLRSLDTSELAGPLRQAVLAGHATKLFLQAREAGLIVDLTRQRKHNAPRQSVDPVWRAPGSAAAASHSHRLPNQRFVEIRNGKAYVINDVGEDQLEYPVIDAVDAAISGDGVVFYVRPDRIATICGEADGDWHRCRDLPDLIDVGAQVSIIASPALQAASGGRFRLLIGSDAETRIVDPDQPGESRPMRRTTAALQAALSLGGLAIPNARLQWLVATLDRESAETTVAQGSPALDWRFFRVSPDEGLYAPVLEVTALEDVFPSAFDTLPGLGRTVANGHRATDVLLERYLRLDTKTRRQRCTIYYRIRSPPGSWVIEYWLYYPFDVGGLGSHLHDPEHFFVEVDKLGGAVRGAIGAAHGYFAPNNIYRSDRRGALAINLPLYAMVEQHKHATAPDIDRDRVFTPGIDENEYKERAKVWGVRDVIGTNNNQLMSFDRTMSADRKPEDFLAPLAVLSRYPNATNLAAVACCRLEPLPEAPGNLKPCDDPTAECARNSVMAHPDFVDPHTILKDWVFPHQFMRLNYGLGPRQRLHSLGVGIASDLDRLPGLSRFMPLPGRVGAEVFGWRQDRTEYVNTNDPDSCIAKCTREYGVGVGVRYEQFLSNFFGIYSSIRVWSPPVSDMWITFGPMVEVPLGNSSNASFQAGLAFRPYASPRFEMRMSIGLWKPRTAEVGLRARPDEER
jgi:hypothetical protein